MKKSILITAFMLILLNVLLGLAITSYGKVPMTLNCIVIVANALLLSGVSSMQLHDGFRYSLYCLFSIATVVEFIICLFSPDRFNDNWALITIIVMLVIEVVLLLAASGISKNISKD